MQDEVNEKVVALSIKGSKLTAEMLQKAMKALLAKGKQQIGKQPHGKQTLRQLMKQNTGVSNIEITDGNSPELKRQAVEAYLAGEGSQIEIATKYHLRSDKQRTML